MGRKNILLLAMIADGNKKIRHVRHVGIMEVVMELRRCCEAKEETIRHELGLSPAEYTCLSVFPVDTELSLAEASNLMGITPSRGSRVVDRLVGKQLISRQGDVRDRRLVSLRLTDKGVKAHNELVECLAQCDADVAGRLTVQEQGAAQEGMQLLLRAFKGVNDAD